jgi:hypothetical protein
MVSCPYCGKINKLGVKFCEQCRADLRALALVPTPPIPEEGLPSTVRIPKVPLVEKLPPADTNRSAGGEDGPPTSVIKGTPPLYRNDRVGTQPVPPMIPTHLLETHNAGAAVPSLAARNETARGLRTAAAPQVETKMPRLIVLRGVRVGTVYRLYEGNNYIGRPDDRPVDIDLEEQEPADKVWASRQHARIVLENGVLSLEDLNSLNGTYVNRARVHPGQQRVLQANDVIQIGTVQLKVAF